ncbi:MAG TPA: hypothetical protein VGK73_36385 [Polyangiaceae bacterium]
MEASFADPAAALQLPSADVMGAFVKFAELGARGGFAGRRHDPANSSIELQASSLSARGVACEYGLLNVAPESVRALLGALSFIDAKVVPLRDVAVSAPASWIGAETSPGGHFSPTQFPFTDERTFTSSGYNIDLRFFDAPSPGVLDQVETAFGTWFSGANVGCFSGPQVTAALAHVYMDDDPRVGDDFTSIELDEVLLAEPDATDALVNVLHWVHRHVAPLYDVTLYE